MDGFELLRRICKTDARTPVLMLTARSAVTDVVHGFELGCNDYLKKPFGMQELIVRLRALVGRARAEATPATSSDTATATDRFALGDYLLDAASQRLTHVPTATVHELSHRESEILRRLCRSHGQVVTSQSLLLELWGDDTFFNHKSLHVFITKLRHRLASDPHIRILNVRGIGYKLIAE